MRLIHTGTFMACEASSASGAAFSLVRHRPTIKDPAGVRFMATSCASLLQLTKFSLSTRAELPSTERERKRAHTFSQTPCCSSGSHRSRVATARTIRLGHISSRAPSCRARIRRGSIETPLPCFGAKSCPPIRAIHACVLNRPSFHLSNRVDLLPHVIRRSLSPHPTRD